MVSDAVAAAEREDWPACLTALLAAWRSQRDPVLAELIERVGAHITVPVVAMTAKAIYARCKTSTDADVSAILAAIDAQLRDQSSIAGAAIELANARDADPRVARMLAKLYVRSPHRKDPSGLDLPLADALDKMDDPRFRELFAAVANEYAPRRNRFQPYKRAQIDHIVELADLNSSRPRPRELTADERANLARIERSLLVPSKRAASTAELFAAIVAKPTDTTARLVYADALQEAGDPRGEFIALQCHRGDGKPSRRESELEKAHARAWLGPLEPVLLKQGLRYRRGFAAVGTLGYELQHREDPSWHLFEELDVRTCRHVGDWLPTLRGLRRVTGIGGRDLAGIVRHGTVAWTSVGAVDPRELADHAGVFPDVVELDVHANALEGNAIAAMSTLVAQLHRIRVAVWSHAEPDQLRVVHRLAELGLEIEVVLANHASTLFVIKGPHLVITARKNLEDTIRFLPGLRRVIRTASGTEPLHETLVAALRANGIEVV